MSKNHDMSLYEKAIKIPKDKEEEIFRASLAGIQSSYMGRYPDFVYAAIKAFGYTKMANHFGKSTESVHKWFRLSRIPADYLPQVSELLDIEQKHFKKEFRG